MSIKLINNITNNLIMTQIKIFADTTYQGSGAGPDAFTIEMLNQEVNAL